MRRIIILVQLLAACGTAQSVAHQSVTAVSGNPADHGAVPGDGVSDRLAFQAAIDSGLAAIAVGPGVWDFDRSGAGSYNAYAALSIHRSDVAIQCAPGAVLRIAGDQGGQAITLVSIEPGSTGISITGCTAELAATNTSEQTHAFATSGRCAGESCRTIEGIRIAGNTFRWRRTGSGRVGDSVKLLGNTAATALRGVRIVDNTFERCGRSCATIQRGADGVVIANNTMVCDGDQCIDFEPTGGGWATDVTITGNTMNAAAEAQGDFDVAVSSARRVTFSNNTLRRGISIYRTEDVTITGNTITHTARSNAPTIDVANACDGLVLANNTVRRGGVAGPVVKLEPHSGAVCSGFVLGDNTITQGTAQGAIMAVSTSRAGISGNTITHTVAAGGFASIYVLSASIESPITALSIGDNTVHGAPTYAITLEGKPGRFALGVALRGNTAVGTTFGLRIRNPDYFSSPVVRANNNLGPGAHEGVTFSNGE